MDERAKQFIESQIFVEDVMDDAKDKKMHVEFDVTLQCNFSCKNCNRHSNFNDLKDPFDKTNQVGLNYYENTDVSLDYTQKFIDDIKELDSVDRLFILGGEPLVHPEIDKICDMLREQLYIKQVKAMWIISNIHPKMLKAGTLDTPEQIIEYLPDFTTKDILEGNIGLARMANYARYTLIALIQNLESGMTKEDIIKDIDNLVVEMVIPGQNNDQLVPYPLRNLLENMQMFHGIPVINHKPLSAKAAEHRVTLVAPYDSGQEVIEKCNMPKRCGINYSYDGYWPCSVGATIARLFKLEDKYKKDKLPKNYKDSWDGIDEEGYAIVKSEGMWDMCKYCQVAAKNQLWERDHGRPISVSYRRAMGLEEGEIPGLEGQNGGELSQYIMPAHKKRLKHAAVRNVKDKDDKKNS